MNRQDAVLAILIGVILAPVMGLLEGVAWYWILISPFVGGVFGYLLGRRAIYFRRTRGWTDTSEAPHPRGEEYAPRSNQVRAILSIAAIIAGVASAVIVFLIVNR